MQVVVLAAGLGSRLGALTAARPKALVEVAGRALVDHAVSFARAAGGARVVVVAGFGAAELRAHLRGAGVEVVDNPAYRDGNLRSLRAALPALDPRAGWLIMNVDHIYRPAIAERVVATARDAGEVTAFCDRDRALGADDMKVALDAGGRVAAIAKTLASWEAGYVGMTWVPAARAAAHRAAAEAAADPADHVETLLPGAAVADVSGIGWLEIDDPEELARANQQLRVRS